MSVIRSVIFSSVCLLVILIQGCNRNKSIHTGNTGITKSNPLFAGLFSIDHTDSCIIVSINNPWQGADNVRFSYCLIKRGMKIPAGYDSSDVIFIPLRKIICMSTTHLAMVSALGEESSIVGISGKDYIYSASIRRMIEHDSVKDVGYDTNINKEMIIDLDPDLIMMYGIGSESAAYVGRLRELGIKVAFDAEYLENNPLARAEWIKVFGALFCREALADSIFRAEVDSYNSIKNFIASNISHRPAVLLGLPFKDTWYISPGNSYMSKLISDAGGSYLWKDNKSATAVPMGIENVFVKAMSADYWLNTGSASSRKEIALVDRRFEDLNCYINDNIYNNDNRTTKKGGNDYWENGILHPHIILNDIACVLHPELFHNYSLVYYRRIR